MTCNAIRPGNCRSVARLCALALVAAASCGRQAPATGIAHDFGAIPWGTAVSHDLVVPHDGSDAMRAVDVRLDCVCASATLVAKSKRGERMLADTAWDDKRLACDEELVLRIRIDTAEKPVADEPVASHVAELTVVHGDGDAAREAAIPVDLRYGIDAPFRVLPEPTMDFGPVRKGGQRTLRVQVVPDATDRPFSFGSPRSDDPRIRCELEHGPDGCAQIATTLAITPDNGAGLLAGWVELAHGEGVPPLRIPWTARVVSGMEASTNSLGFGSFDPAAAIERSFVVVDNDHEVAPALEVRKLVDHAGKDLSDVFEVAMAPEAASAASTRVTLRWRAGAAGRGSIRGSLALGRVGGEGPALYVGIAAFPLQPR